jgi:hypothetical protein
MVVMFLSDVAGKQKWLDYIPVKLQGTVPNTYDNNGFIPVVATTATGETVPFKDYVPVFVDSSATDAWQVNNVGYIPYNYLSFSSAALNLDLLSGSLDSRVTFTRASGATRFNASGVLETVATNVPRFDHDPVTLAPRGLLIEGARTNSLLNSGITLGVDGAVPTSFIERGAVTGRRIAGGGALGTNSPDCMRITRASGGGGVSTTDDVRQAITGLTAVQPYAVSFKARLGPGSVSNALLVDFIGAARTYTLTNQYQVFTFVVNAIGTAHNIFWGAPVGSNGLVADVTDIQIELGAFASSYIPTTSSQVTRAADVAVMTGTNFSSWYNQTEGTFFAEGSGAIASAGGFRRFVEVGTDASRITLGYNVDSRSVFFVRDTNNTQAELVSAAGLQVTQLVKTAGAYKLNDFQAATSGVLSSADTLGTVPTVSQLFLGASEIDPVNRTLFGHIRRIAYWNTRLTNAELQSLTS